MSNNPILDRVLVLATHPDDDVIGAGGLIQHTVNRGGRVRILFITGGENNAWPQRAVYRRWRITREDQMEWASVRSNEARAALRLIGADPGSAFFLGYGDQQISTLARNGDQRLPDDLRRHAAEFNPTLVVSPSFFDVHKDHRATAYFAHMTFGTETPIATYAVHGLPPAMRTLFTVRLTPEEQSTKREAIGCHKTQLLLSRERFLAHARATETFYAPEHDLVRLDTPFEELVSAMRHSFRAVAGMFEGPPAFPLPDETPVATPAIFEAREPAELVATSPRRGLTRVRDFIRRR